MSLTYTYNGKVSSVFTNPLKRYEIDGLDPQRLEQIISTAVPKSWFVRIGTKIGLSKIDLMSEAYFNLIGEEFPEQNLKYLMRCSFGSDQLYYYNRVTIDAILFRETGRSARDGEPNATRYNNKLLCNELGFKPIGKNESSLPIENYWTGASYGDLLFHITQPTPKRRKEAVQLVSCFLDWWLMSDRERGELPSQVLGLANFLYNPNFRTRIIKKQSKLD